ncbi:MAG TPA: L-glutamate gamma-semialdehyde dehydrogenase [Rhodothermia bacterium]
MLNSKSSVPPPVNEPVLQYRPGSPEREVLQRTLKQLKNEFVEIPVVIGGKRIHTERTLDVTAPHDHRTHLGRLHQVSEAEISDAIKAAMAARLDWMRMDWQDRAAIFLRAGELLAGPWRARLNAATMLCQSKTAYQAEIDSACELIDFFRFNAYFMQRIYEDQPFSTSAAWNRMEYRGLEGFVFAVTPFNFTSIGGNLPTAPAIMGNTVLWKPATTAAYSSWFIYRILEEAGLPPGVINFVPGPGRTVGTPTFASEHFAGLHFTGSTSTFQFMWKTISEQIAKYRTYPRIVGETGGKDFILAHASAHPAEVATAIVRGGFEYQGQKCSAASRVYIPDSLWGSVRDHMVEQLESIKMGPVDDFTNFMNAVIDKPAFDSISGYIDAAAARDDVEVVFGGGHDDSEGYYIEPTVLKVSDPSYRTMCEEIFGPVVSVYVYPEADWLDTLKLVDQTSPYALTGAVFATDRRAISRATTELAEAAGNFYINDKPTGAVVGQQPFGGARASGTNDKAGSFLNLVRWVSARSIKETFAPPRHYGYPFMEPDLD